MKYIVGFLIIASVFLQGCLASSGYFWQGVAKGVSGQRMSAYQNRRLELEKRQAEALEEQLRYERAGF